jgi:CRP-like cAMP-binding protein
MVDAFAQRAEDGWRRQRVRAQPARRTPEDIMTDQALVEALRQSRLGAESEQRPASNAGRHLRFRDLERGDVLVPQGTSDNHLYVIVDGALGVVRDAGSPSASRW